MIDGRVAWRLERLPTVPKTTVRDPPRAIGWTLAHCPPSSEWGPGGNTGEMKAARKGTGHPTSKSRLLSTSVLSNRHPPTYGSYIGLTFTFTDMMEYLDMDKAQTNFVISKNNRNCN